MKKLIGLLSVLMISSFASADDIQVKIESWSNTDALKCVKRDDNGKFVDSGVLSFENWSNSEESQWTCRNANGNFVYGATGQLEKFAVKGEANERLYVVFRDQDGQFVTLKALDDKVTAGWESYGQGNSRYVIRYYNGRILNSGFGKVEMTSNGQKRCTVRDTADGRNNGKILTWILADKSGRFHNPADGKFISCRGPR